MPEKYIPYWKTGEQTPRERARRLERERHRQKAWQERIKDKLSGRLDCNRCGPGLREPATYCGFCEIELGLAPAR